VINKKAKLAKKIFEKDIEMVATRQGYGEGLVIAGEKDERVVVLCADLTESTRSILFQDNCRWDGQLRQNPLYFFICRFFPGPELGAD